MALTADQIDKADDLPVLRLRVPEWGGEVVIRTLPGTDRDAFEAAHAGLDEQAKKRNFRAKVVALCLVDDAGNRLYGDDQVERLGRRSGKVLDRIFDAAWEFNGLGQKAVEQAEKNSASDPSSASTSG